MVWKAVAATALLWSTAGTAAAVGSIADVTVYDRARHRILPVYQHEGRHYVVGQPGNEYQIRIRNRTGTEILAVVSVDGVNAVSGETANWHQTGYVLAPYQNLPVKGWRKSLQRVAAFYFTEHENSYAARTGRPQDVGVIGVALFRKKAEPQAQIGGKRPRRGPWGEEEESPFPGSGEHSDAESGSAFSGRALPAPFEQAKQESADAAASAEPGSPVDREAAHDPTGRPSARARQRAPESRAAEKSSSLGTGHGRSRTSHARYTSFERATLHPEEMITIHYDTHHNLVAQGVIGAPRVATPFPGQFVPDPR